MGSYFLHSFFQSIFWLAWKRKLAQPNRCRFVLQGFNWLKDRWVMDDKSKKLSELATKLGVTTPALSIAWCIKNPNVSTAILGLQKNAIAR